MHMGRPSDKTHRRYARAPPPSERTSALTEQAAATDDARTAVRIAEPETQVWSSS
jgi:hypothetical protein